MDRRPSWARAKISSPSGVKPRNVKPIGSLYIDWATPAHTLNSIEFVSLQLAEKWCILRSTYFCFLWVLKYTVITFLSSLKRIVFITDIDVVPCELGTEFLYTWQKDVGRATACGVWLTTSCTLSHPCRTFLNPRTDSLPCRIAVSMLIIQQLSLT